MPFKSYAQANIARFLSDYTLRTFNSAAGEGIWVDSVAVPRNSHGVLIAASQGHPSVLGTDVGFFVCSPDMGQNSNPFLPNGVTLDPSKIGPMFYEDGSNLNNIGFMGAAGVGYINVPEGWFIRIASLNAPAAGNFSTSRLGLAIIPNCEVC